MSAKLTLTVEEKIIKQAKAYAKKQNRSLSNIIETYLKKIVEDNLIEEKNEEPSLVNELRGSYRTNPELDYDKELEKRRDTKYLK